MDGDLYMNILAARQEAFDKAFSERLQAADDDGKNTCEEQETKKRKVKPMKAGAKHRDYAPQHLTMKSLGRRRG